MASDYSKDMYRQMMELYEKVDALTALVSELKQRYKEDMAEKDSRIETLEKENTLLREEVSRLKSDRNNNSSNSSNPPSSDQKGAKRANEYNSRKKSGKKQGGQAGHRGVTLTKEIAEKMIASGECSHAVEIIGDPSAGNPTVKYEIDINVETQITEYRIYEEYEASEMPCGDVFYGPRIKAFTVELYGIGVVSIKRIQDIIWSITRKMINVAAGTLYGFCRKFAARGKNSLKQIEEHLLDGSVAYTDATVVTIDGKQGYIRNVSNDSAVRYYAMSKKDLETLKKIEILARFAGFLMHDHETALYHFGIDHAECNSHLLRYLLKNSEDSTNNWSMQLSDLLMAMKESREKAIADGRKKFTDEELEDYYLRYNKILSTGRVENRSTSPKWAKREESALLNRLEKYRDNHLLFLKNFEIAFTNNMSERDLWKCKNRQKVAGGFRNMEGCEMFADILSIIETAKRQSLNPYDVILALFQSSDSVFSF